MAAREGVTRLVIGAAKLGRDAARVAMTGVPAVRAALHGARLGAGPGFTAEVVERLGIAILPAPAQVIAKGLLKGGKAVGVALARKGAVVRAEAQRVVVHSRDGVQLTVAPGGAVAASASEETVRAIARSTAKTAMKGIGRAALQGAVAGAVLDGGLAAIGAWRGVRSGSLTGRDAGVRVLLGASRGAVAGAAGVAAAGVVSAAVAFTGITIAGAPIVLPIVTMAGTSALVGRAFDRTVRARALALSSGAERA
ncbi:MAG: hypothetical protein JNK05_19275 [Myxococcales bacterium]|nr:hypothetical protein [Myxococcales bacterium]